MFAGIKIITTFALAIEKQRCPDGGIGRRAGLKHQWSNIHPGSTPGLGTRKRAKYLISQILSSFLFLQLVPKLFPFVFMYNISINTQIIIMNKKCR